MKIKHEPWVKEYSVVTLHYVSYTTLHVPRRHHPSRTWLKALPHLDILKRLDAGVEVGQFPGQRLSPQSKLEGAMDRERESE